MERCKTVAMVLEMVDDREEWGNSDAAGDANGDFRPEYVDDRTAERSVSVQLNLTGA